MVAKRRARFTKVYDDMPDHPKIVGLTDAAFRLLVELWIYASKHDTDGLVPAVYAARRGRRPLEELHQHLLITDGAESIQIHDYAQHQTTRDERAAIRSKRQDAARRRWDREDGL